MSYIRAEEVLPQKLLEEIQQYVHGKAIYIPVSEKQEWGSRTDAKGYYQRRNLTIYTEYCNGYTSNELVKKYALSEKSIQRIIRTVKNGVSDNAN
ncbi:MAG TPA: hypothetical protein DEF30_07990 [Proteiniclasticum sp.]|uniref:CD3324 family protein n=1 Tax=Proteiniclasticum sp. TaxID=2053595 RepID=UPI000E87F353|nr:CD3324 family protein [Proteiniclasticum sp.]HBW13743.1 hypothetical protein [Proteiniclasticum sp.]